jgi:hypothetical protein
VNSRGTALRKILSVFIVLAGAEVGGGFPGALLAALLAFYLVAKAGIGAEAVCLCVNLFLGVAGALCGLVIGKRIDRTGFRDTDLILPITAGLAAGLVGYYLLYHAATWP